MTTALRVNCNNGSISTLDAFDKMFAPLFQHSVGFDRMFNTMNSALRETGQHGSYPPYDIVQVGENDYTITIALAGFTSGDINIELNNGELTVSGGKPKVETPEDSRFIHKGIAHRKFVRRFRLTDHIRVEGAELKDGLLTIALVRELPEALKPRTIEITQS